MADQHPVPNWQLEIDGNPLPSSYLSLVDSVSLKQSFDGADMLSIDCRGWDAREGEFRIIGENIMGPGASILLRAGYGAELREKVRTDLTRFEPTFGADAIRISVVGYDALRKLQTNKNPWDFGRPGRYSDVARLLGNQYGFDVQIDESRKILYKLRKLTKRKRKKAGKRPKIGKGKGRQKLIKKAGVNDLTFLKWMASSAGFRWPKIVRREGRDVLQFISPKTSVDDLPKQVFEYVTLGEDRQATLTSMTPSMSFANLPRAVRVTGRSAKGQVIVVEAELDERDFLRRGADAIRVRNLGKRPIRKQEKKTFARPGAIVLDILGAEKASKRYDPSKRKKVQVMGRDVIKQQILTTDITSLEQIARGWLRARLQLYQTCECTLSNVPDSDRLAPGQIHKISGVSVEYEGFWLIRTADHRWSPQDHQVSMKMQRLQSKPPHTRAVRLKKVLTAKEREAVAFSSGT